MVQCLVHVFTCKKISCFVDVTRLSLLKRVLLGLLIFQSPNLDAAGALAPAWTVPLEQHSNDGYAVLSWAQPEAESADFFKITENYEGSTFVHFTEATSLQARRVLPGTYGFVLQACIKTPAYVPDCGANSDVLTLTVAEDTSSTVTADNTTASPATAGSVATGGPAQLWPGQWYNPSKDGHGWSFYWSNRLALAPDDVLFGNHYDLVGIWYTYEAKAAIGAAGCLACPPDTGSYRPVALKLKAVATGPESYGGSLYVSRPDGSDVWVGSADITFAADSSSATINWHANFKKESLSAIDPLVFLHGADPADANNISHLSGIWKPRGNDNYFVVSDIGDTAEVSTIVFHDDAGDPVWIQAVDGSTPTPRSTDLCFGYLSNGYSPQQARPSGWSKRWYFSGCDANLPPGFNNRNGLRYFSSTPKEIFWAEFSLPGGLLASGSVRIGLRSFLPAVLDKQANFHGVSYDSNSGESCELSTAVPVCNLELTWFTGGNYPDATVFAHSYTNGDYYKVATATQAAMVDFPYQIYRDGIYDFELRMGDSEQTTLIAKSELFTVTGSSANPETPPEPALPPPMDASASSSRVGATVGEFSVDESGSATYTIPILTAPASGDVAPRISLNYSSQRGTGEAGLGWAIGGISVITRCPQTMEQDGISGSRNIGLDGEDRFCLDGQRLVVVPGSGEYGGHGTRYRTEVDNFTRVTSYGSAGQGPAWFRVENKNGSVIEYGNSTDSRIEARGSNSPGTVVNWAQNRFEDQSGNYMLYNYHENSEGPVEYVLHTVDYTGNTHAGTLPSARLTFVYGDRSDAMDLSFSYLSGARFEQRRLLQSIRSQGRLQAGTPLEDLRFYALSYDEDGLGRKILTAFTECRSVDRTICYQPTRFDWIKSESKIDAQAIGMEDLLPKNTLSGLLLGDVSGDGRPDLVYAESKGRNHSLHVRESTSTPGFEEWGASYTLPRKADGGAPRLLAVDINSDGLQDLVYSKYSKTSGDYSWVVLVSKGNRFAAEIELNPGHRFSLDEDGMESRFRIMDFNGDGLSDILHVHTEGQGNSWKLGVLLNTTSPAGRPSVSPFIELDIDNSGLFPFDNIRDWEPGSTFSSFKWGPAASDKTDIPDAGIFDFNGDGSVDLLLNVWRDYKRCISNCTIYTAYDAVSGDSQSISGNSLDPVYEVKTASFWVLMESDGETSFSRHSVVALGEDCTIPEACGVGEYASLPRSNNILPVDINGDGLADLAWASPGGNWFFQLNTGRGFTVGEEIGRVPDGVNSLARFNDWNGDDYPDLIFPSDILDAGSTWMIYQNHFGRAFAAATNTLVPAGNVGGNRMTDPVENDASIFADFSGDGKPDQLFIDNKKSGVIKAIQMRRGMNVSGSHAIEAGNVITAITNGFGAVTEITYRPLTDNDVYTRMYDSVAANWGQGAPVYDYIAPIFVVSRSSSSSPVDGDAAARNSTEYHYVGAKLQAGGRGLLGFAEIIVYNPQTRISTNTRYRQDFPFTGLPAETIRISRTAGTKFSPVTAVSSLQPTNWSALTPGAQPPAGLSGTLLSHSINHWREDQTVPGAWRIHTDASTSRSYTLAGNLESKVFTQNSHDHYGNLTKSVVSTFADEETLFSRRTIENQWSGVTLPNWNLGRLESSTVTHNRAGRQAVVRKSAFEYDNTTGLISKEIIEPGSSSLNVSTTYSYDLFGNRNSTSIKGAGMSARTSLVTHDALGRFVISETNALGQEFRKVSPAQWDIFGNPLEIENIDGVVSINAVDFMGRSFASRNETGAWQKTLNHSGRGNDCPAGTVWHSLGTSGGGPATQQCYDVVGRKIRSVSKGINGQLIYVDQSYDESGRPVRISEPYFASDTPYWNETAYDKLGRVVGLLSAGGDDISNSYDERASSSCIPAGPGVVVTVNALGQQTTEVRNVLGEVTDSFDTHCGRVSFSYDSMGYLIGVTGEDGTSIRMSYDGAGRKTMQSDPDRGHWQYAYNPLGELIRQLDGQQQAIDFEYDALGRVSHRRELIDVASLADSAATVVNHETTQYRSVGPGKSQPETVTYREGESGAIIHQQISTYDWLGRVSGVSSTVGDQQFFEQTTYDAHGRIFQQFDASGDDHGLRYVYRHGHLSQIKEAREGLYGRVYQDILSMDARGNVTTAELGNGVVVFADYQPASGHLISLRAYDQLGIELQDVGYLFDALGNLKIRHDLSGSNEFKESFAYDSLNRLRQVSLTAPGMGIAHPVETLALEYGASGNITWKSDVGAYTYGSGGAGPHAVTAAGNQTYGYDVNGNQLHGDGRIITYTVFDKAARLTAGNQETIFSYGIGNHRVKRLDSEDGVVQKDTTYLGSVEYVTRADGSTLFKRYLGGVAIATYYPATCRQQVSYLLKDHIGSIHSVLDENGSIITRMHFSPFGERQDFDWQTPLDNYLYAPLNNLTTRGFTGHEHVDSMRIIHMNGRIYDAKLGRFLQADPFVQAPKNTQNLNRYSYVFNNPLSYTDPSGFFSLSKFFKKWGRTIAAIAASIFLPGTGGILALQFGVNSAFAQYVITGFIAGGITGGIKGAVKGAFLAAVTYGVTHAFNQSPNGGVQLDESKLAPTRENLDHMLGASDPAAGLYRIEVGPKGGFGNVMSISANGVRSGETIFSNGLGNNFQEAVRNGTTQVSQLDGVASGYILSFNPTKTLIPDTLESLRDITNTYFGFGHTDLAENLARVIDVASKNGVTGLRLIGHSQGAAITTSALRFAADTGLDMSAVSSVNLHGAPLNDRYVKGALAKRSGMGRTSVITRAQFGDPVHNILGANFLSNPLSLPFSAIRFPQLFSNDATVSPHTVPCFGGRMTLCSG